MIQINQFILSKYAYPEGINALKESNNIDNHTLEYSGRCGKKIIDVANCLLQSANESGQAFS